MQQLLCRAFYKNPHKLRIRLPGILF